MPVMFGSTTASTAAAVTAASIALPPRSITASPADVANGWLVAITAFGAYTADRPAMVVDRRAGCCAPGTAVTSSAAMRTVQVFFMVRSVAEREPRRLTRVMTGDDPGPSPRLPFDAAPTTDGHHRHRRAHPGHRPRERRVRDDRGDAVQRTSLRQRGPVRSTLGPIREGTQHRLVEPGELRPSAERRHRARARRGPCRQPPKCGPAIRPA